MIVGYDGMTYKEIIYSVYVQSFNEHFSTNVSQNSLNILYQIINKVSVSLEVREYAQEVIYRIKLGMSYSLMRSEEFNQTSVESFDLLCQEIKSSPYFKNEISQFIEKSEVKIEKTKEFLEKFNYLPYEDIINGSYLNEGNFKTVRRKANSFLTKMNKIDSFIKKQCENKIQNILNKVEEFCVDYYKDSLTSTVNVYNYSKYHYVSSGILYTALDTDKILICSSANKDELRYLASYYSNYGHKELYIFNLQNLRFFDDDKIKYCFDHLFKKDNDILILYENIEVLANFTTSTEEIATDSQVEFLKKIYTHIQKLSTKDNIKQVIHSPIYNSTLSKVINSFLPDDDLVNHIMCRYPTFSEFVRSLEIKYECDSLTEYIRTHCYCFGYNELNNILNDEKETSLKQKIENIYKVINSPFRRLMLSISDASFVLDSSWNYSDNQKRINVLDDIVIRDKTFDYDILPIFSQEKMKKIITSDKITEYGRIGLVLEYALTYFQDSGEFISLKEDEKVSRICHACSILSQILLIPNPTIEIVPKNEENYFLGKNCLRGKLIKIRKDVLVQYSTLFDVILHELYHSVQFMAPIQKKYYISYLGIDEERINFWQNNNNNYISRNNSTWKTIAPDNTGDSFLFLEHCYEMQVLEADAEIFAKTCSRHALAYRSVIINE